MSCEHPGDILRAVLTERGMSAYRLSMETGISQQRIGRILNRLHGISADTSIRLGVALGVNPGYWLSVQSAWDIQQAMGGRRA